MSCLAFYFMLIFLSSLMILFLVSDFSFCSSAVAFLLLLKSEDASPASNFCMTSFMLSLPLLSLSVGMLFMVNLLLKYCFFLGVSASMVISPFSGLDGVAFFCYL